MADTPVADPTNIDAVIKSFENYNSVAEKVAAGMKALISETDKTSLKINTLSQVTNIGANIINNLSGSFSDMTNSLKNLNSMSDAGIFKFSQLAIAAVGAKESFNFNSIDSSGLNLFTDQISDLFEIMRSAPGTAMATDAVKKLSTYLINLGANQNEVTRQAHMGSGALEQYAKSFLTGADNGLKLGHAFIHMAASSGNLNDVIKDSGEDLSKMNDLLSTQTNMLSKAQESTGLASSKLEGFWEQLGPIVTNLNNMNVTLAGSSDSTNILTTAVRLASGSGRDYKDVIDDLNKAVIKYGLSTSDAFTFTARIGEISSKFKAPMDDVRKSLLGSADAFRMFADAGANSAKQSEGFANILNSYLGALKNTGLNATDSIDVITNMTGAIKGLGIEQKAFLSQQSGGPGGLQGGYQIEKMLREGKTSDVFEMVRKQMQKQMGKIVTLDEAASNPAAAMQMEKQKQLLQKGPMGQFARTDQEAYRILEMFKKRQEGTTSVESLSGLSAQKQVEQGKSIMGLSKTPMSELRGTLQSIRYTADIGNLSSLQKIMTEKAGVNTNLDTADQKEMRARLGKESNKELDRNASVGSNAIESIRNITQNAKNSVINTGKAVADGIKQSIGVTPSLDESAEREALRNDINSAKQKSLMQFKPSEYSSLEEDTFGQPINSNAGDSVGKAALNASNIGNKNKQSVSNQHTTENHKNQSEEMNFKVNVSAICSVCKHNLEISSQSRATNPTHGA